MLMKLDLVRKKIEINRKIQEKDSRIEIVAEQQIDNEIYGIKQRALLAHDGTMPTHTNQYF